MKLFHSTAYFVRSFPALWSRTGRARLPLPLVFYLSQKLMKGLVILLISGTTSVVLQRPNLAHGIQAVPRNISSAHDTFNVSLDLVSINSIRIPNTTQKGLTVISALHNTTSNRIALRSGCMAPLVHLHVGDGTNVFTPTSDAHMQTNSCLPTLMTVPARSTQTLSNTYLLRDARSRQAIPQGTYQVQEELTYTMLTGDPAGRYKKLSDNSLVDTFPSRLVHSNSLLLTITSTGSRVAPTMSTSTTAQAALIQSSAGHSSSANPSRSFSYDVQKGDLLVAVMSCASHSLGLPIDSLGNVWAAALTQTAGRHFAYRQGLFYAVTAKSGAEKITFTCKGRSSFALIEFSGLKSTPFDQMGQATGTSTTQSVVTSSAGTTQAYELVLGFVGDNLTTRHTYTVTSPEYTEIQHSTSRDGTLELAYTTTSVQGTFTTSWESSRRVAWGALQATFKIAPPPLTYPLNSLVGPFSPKVLVIDYNTSGKADDGSAALTRRLISDWTTASSFHGSSFSSVHFHIYDTFVENNPPPILPGTKHGTDTGDYQAIFEKYAICSLAAALGVNFVWIWASGSEQGGIFYAGDFYEWVTTGPTFYQTYGANVPTCGSHTVVTFGLNYSRAPAEALHSTGHYMENVLQFAFGPSTDLSTGQPGGTDMYDLFDRQAARYNGYTGPLNTHSASCGDVHFPPNTVASYDYGNTTVVWSACSDFNPGNPSSQFYWLVSASSWQGIPCDPSLELNSFDCNQESYLLWWMQNMPGYNNATSDLYQYDMPNWWQYLVALDTTIRYN